VTLCTLLGRYDQNTDPEDFFKSPTKYQEAATVLKNPQTWDLVGTRDPSAQNIDPLVHALARTFRYAKNVKPTHASVVGSQLISCIPCHVFSFQRVSCIPFFVLAPSLSQLKRKLVDGCLLHAILLGWL
jgi:hypothetical protein